MRGGIESLPPLMQGTSNEPWYATFQQQIDGRLLRINSFAHRNLICCCIPTHKEVVIRERCIRSAAIVIASIFNVVELRTIKLC